MPDTLSEQAALALAENQNLSIRFSQFELKQSEARLREVGASRYPSLQLRSHSLISSVVGAILIVAAVAENSILLVHYFRPHRRDGLPLHEALIDAGIACVSVRSL